MQRHNKKNRIERMKLNFWNWAGQVDMSNCGQQMDKKNLK